MARDDVAQPQAGGRVRRFALRYWVAMVLAALAAIFVAQNRDRVSVHVLWVTVDSPMWFILVIIFLVGILIGLLLHRRRK
ncbi:MAG: lipopolysaccharide assembly protein LapA domain-containing protein [Mycobacterium sp.]